MLILIFDWLEFMASSFGQFFVLLFTLKLIQWCIAWNKVCTKRETPRHRVFFGYELLTLLLGHRFDYWLSQNNFAGLEGYGRKV